MLAGVLVLMSYACVLQSTASGLKRKASEMSGGSFGSAISRGSADSGTSANSKVLLHLHPVLVCGAGQSAREGTMPVIEG